MDTTLFPSGRPPWFIVYALLLSTIATGLTGCVSVELRPQKTTHLEITVPDDWRGLYKTLKPRDVTTDDANAAIEAAIIRHYAAVQGAPRVTDVIIVRWWVKEKHEDRIVLEGDPALVSIRHFEVYPLNLYSSGTRITEFDKVTLTLRFEK